LNRSPGRVATAPIFLLFLFSGATSLVYEVVWLRQLILIFGSTQFATSTILSTFMAGLALGAWLGGRWLAGRTVSSLRVYGWLEIGIGAYALLVPFLFGALSPLYRAIWDAGGSDSFVLFSLAKFVGIALVLLPPTILMGASLPVLSREVADDPQRIGGKVGALYAINTFGAVAGTFLAGFFAVPALGVQQTLWITAAINGLIGLLAMFYARPARQEQVAAVEAQPAVAASRRAPAWIVLLVIAGSGFAALAMEVAWTRVLALILGSSVYAFSLMLVAFLVGLASGGAVFSAYLRRRPQADPARLLACLLGSAGALGYLTTFLFARLPEVVATIFFRWSLTAESWFAVQFLLALSIMLPATFAFGGIFPTVLQLHARGLDRVSSAVGTVYASNTAGTIVGAPIAGFLLIPWLGAQPTVIAMSCGVAALGLLVVWFVVPRGVRGRLVLAGALLLVIGATLTLRPRWDTMAMNSGVYMSLHESEEGQGWDGFIADLRENHVIVYAEEGLTASVFVADQPEYDNRYLAVNGKIDASTRADLETQLMLGHLPLLLHGEARDVMVIGLASGISAGAVATHPVDRIRIVELERAMLNAARFFDEANNGVLDDPRVEWSINDSRNELEFNDRTYDVIISEPSNPWMTVASNLFTEDFFRMARERVREDGIFCQWVQNYYLGTDDLRSIIAAFRHSFPNVMLFETYEGVDLLLMGSERPLALDLEQMRARASELKVAIDLRRVSVDDALDLVPLFRMGTAGIDRLIEGAPLNTDDNARVEFSAPKSFGRDTLTENSELLHRIAENPLDHFQPPVTDERRRSELELALARRWAWRKDWDLAAAAAQRVKVEDLLDPAREIRLAAEAEMADSASPAP